MSFQLINDKKVIETHFRKNTGLNLYQLGDLDDFFWKYTKWFSLKDASEVSQIILLYSGTELPVILALCDSDFEEMKTLLNNIINILPKKFYSHLSPGLKEALKSRYNFTSHGTYLKMTLDKSDFKFQTEDENIRRLISSDLSELLEFYNKSYPDNWFDRRMLETGKYFGYFLNGKIAAVSGIHVYSPEYKIAVLGNITTHPELRGKSLCAGVTACLCTDLFETVDNIGLNVHCENIPAIRSYEKIGFKKIAEYEEYMFEDLSDS